jgi:hypothetical protein
VVLADVSKLATSTASHNPDRHCWIAQCAIERAILKRRKTFQFQTHCLLLDISFLAETGAETK